MHQKYPRWWLIGLLLLLLTGCVAPSPLDSTSVPGNMPQPAATPAALPETTVTPVEDQPPAEAEDEVGLEQPFTLGLGQQTSVQNTDLQITFVAVTADSRCPVAENGNSVACVWAGEGLVELQVQTGSDPSTAISLSTLGTADHASSATAGDYTFELVALLPQPTTTQPQPPQAEYQATLVITPAKG